MKICISNISFGDKNIWYHNSTSDIMETFDNCDRLKRRISYDNLGRDIDTKDYNENHEIIRHQHKKYTQNGCLETYRSKTLEYIREMKTIVKDSYTHYIEIYISKTSPQNNYVNEFIRDIKGQLVKIINNGKVINLK